MQTLVIPLVVIVRRERAERPAQMRLTKNDDPVEAFLADRPDEAFAVRVAIRRAVRRLYDTNPRLGQVWRNALLSGRRLGRVFGEHGLARLPPRHVVSDSFRNPTPCAEWSGACSLLVRVPPVDPHVSISQRGKVSERNHLNRAGGHHGPAVEPVVAADML